MTIYYLIRMRGNQRMAEGAKVAADCAADAIEKAKKLFPECPGDTFEIERQVDKETPPQSPGSGVVK
jgi:hypothetical protein